MVYGVLIHQVTSKKKPIVISSFYDPEGNDSHSKERQHALIEHIQRDFILKTNCMDGISRIEGKKSTETIPPSIIYGAFQISSGPLFSKPKMVLWRQFQKLIFVLICEEDENRLLGSTFISLFAQVMIDHFKNPHLFMNPKEIIHKPDEVIVLLNTFLPSGNLLFTNIQYVKHLKKIAEAEMVAK